MSSGRREDSKDDKLLTSEDIFGDMLDEAPAKDAPKPAAKGTPSERRTGPIKVQVSEPGDAARAGPAKTPLARSPLVGPPAEELPDDVAALLDAFSAPGEAAAREAGVAP